METVEKTCSKGRSQAEKVGRIKYTLQCIKALQKDLDEIKLMQRTLLAGLKGLFHFDKPMIQRIACSDEVDEMILELLYESGNAGMLPKGLAARLSQFRIKRHQVSRRILRMNKRVQKEIGETIIEKRGWHWSLTNFTFEIWGEIQELKDAQGSKRDLRS